jgi:hypothetical protein
MKSSKIVPDHGSLNSLDASYGMGVDVYLSWDGMTEEEKKSRNKWLALDNGDAGYLRAPWWMKREVKLLFTVFEGCHIDESPKPVAYDFRAKLSELADAVKEYRKSVEEDEKSAGGKAKVRAMLEGLPTVAGYIDYPFDGLVLEHSENWLKNVFDFFNLGRHKQEEGKNPSVHVL